MGEKTTRNKNISFYQLNFKEKKIFFHSLFRNDCGITEIMIIY